MDAAEPEGQRYELCNGEVVAVAPERARHNLAKAQAWQAMKMAVDRQGLDCTVYTDGMTVVVDESTAYEPDVTVQCGTSLAPDATVANAPTVLIEVLSPTTQGVDTGQKLLDYFRIGSVKHYLVLNPEKGLAVHHARSDGGIATAILSEGTLVLDPPGLAVEIDALLALSAAGESDI